MSTLIVYSSKYGSAEECALSIHSKLDSSDILNLSLDSKVDLSKYDTIIIGSSVYAGQFRKDIKKFLKANLDVLKTKKLALFASCGFGQKMKEYVKNNVPEGLEFIEASALGGRFQFDKMNIAERTIIKTVLKKNPVKINIDQEAINNFVNKVGMYL